MSQSCFHSLNKLLKPDYIVQVWGLVEVNKLHQIGGDSNLFSVSVLSDMSLILTMKRKYPELIPMDRHILFQLGLNWFSFVYIIVSSYHLAFWLLQSLAKATILFLSCISSFSWLTVSKAWEISRYSPATCFLLSRLIMIFSNLLVKACIAEDFVPTSKLTLIERFTIF